MSEDEKLLKEAKKLPWEDRLTHKNWKVRNDANIDLAAVCDSISDPKDPRLREFGPFFRKTVADSNAPVQEKALDALIAYLKAADADAGRYAKEVCDAIVAKCLTGRPKTVEKAQMVFMLWVELEAVEAFLGILSDVLKCLGDNKKQMRECTLSTLDSWLAAAHLDKMVPYVTAALTDTKLGAEGRKDLFDWLSKQLAGLSDFPDAIHLLKPSASAMTDKSADVRKAAEACFNEILRVCGHEMVTKNLKDIQGSALAIVVERLKPYGAFQENFETGRSISSGIASKTSSKVGKSNAYGDRASSSRHGNRVASSSHALLNVKDSNKDDRERMVVRRFKFEELRLEQIQDLENDIMKYFREDLHRRLLSTDFKKQVDGIEMLQKALPSIGRELIEVLDILLRWFVLRFCESNTSCLLKVLEFLPELLEMLRNEGYTMTEAEAAIFLLA
ncbi:UNVERIFIED_CONTAM: protein MOR1 [Sesamum angustifolium]|uniref:Protein MOR1 n=1 Tax=Sesamum angustifolium TaxID=2727405 RepID=A0AAW2PEH0_9LAMI